MTHQAVRKRVFSFQNDKSSIWKNWHLLLGKWALTRWQRKWNTNEAVSQSHICAHTTAAINSIQSCFFKGAISNLCWSLSAAVRTATTPLIDVNGNSSLKSKRLRCLLFFATRGQNYSPSWQTHTLIYHQLSLANMSANSCLLPHPADTHDDSFGVMFICVHQYSLSFGSTPHSTHWTSRVNLLPRITKVVKKSSNTTM